MNEQNVAGTKCTRRELSTCAFMGKQQQQTKPVPCLAQGHLFFLVVRQLDYEVTHPKSKLLPLVIRYASAVIFLKFVVPLLTN